MGGDVLGINARHLEKAVYPNYWAHLTPKPSALCTGTVYCEKSGYTRVGVKFPGDDREFFIKANDIVNITQETKLNPNGEKTYMRTEHYGWYGKVFKHSENESVFLFQMRSNSGIQGWMIFE